MDKDTVKTVLVDGGIPVALNGEENNRFIYNLLPVGRFYDKRYGEIYVGDRMLRQMEANFGKYPAYKVPVKIGHGDGAPSPGEVIGIQATNDGLEITMTVDKETSEEILKKHFRFMSAEFDENYQDKKTGKPVGAVLLGAALVNQPANPFVEPLKFVDAIEPSVPPAGPSDETKDTPPPSGEPPEPPAPAETINPNTPDPNGRNDDMEKEAMEQLRQRLSDTEAREKQAREELAASQEAQKAKEAEAQKRIAELEAGQEAQKAKEAEAQTQADEAQKRIAELEAANKALNEEKEQAEAAKNEAEVKSFCDHWAAQGVPPVMLEKVKPVLLSRSGRTIRLSDDAKDDIPTLKFFDELFAGLPRVPMKQIGSAETPPRELSDLEKAKKRGEAIAASVSSSQF